MSFKTTVSVLALTLFAAATPAHADYPVALRFGCDDVVAIARIQTLGSLASVEDNILDRALFSMRIEVNRFVRGAEHQKSFTAHQFIHAPWRNDRDYLIVLARDGDEYRIREAALWDIDPRPTLKDECPWLKPTP